MKLKELFRYQNTLTEWKCKILGNLNDKDIITITTQKHQYNVQNKNKENETIIANEDKKNSNPKANELIDFLLDIMNEKERVSNIISETKKTFPICIDHEIELNKMRQSIGQTLKELSSIPNSKERKTIGQDFTFNQEGNQVSYCYPIESITTIDFDRNRTKKESNKLLKKADEISLQIEELLLTTDVNIELKWNLHDTYEDIVSTYMKKEED